MTLRTALALAVLLCVAGCGVKSDLVPPDNKPQPKGQQDPSKPPSPIGR
jgi:predicted small lipoprotein YifL